MRIFAISVVKNEADIIRYTLKAASEWATKIFVIDNGSEDQTWEIVNDMKSEIIVPYKQSFEVFNNGIRADIFNAFRSYSVKNDWWCFRLDADEMYVDNVTDFLSKVPPYYRWVFKKSIDYHLTPEDLGREVGANFNELRYFNPVAWIEKRFFRFHPDDQWNRDHVLPTLNGFDCNYEKPIVVKHYQHRSEAQLKRRLQDRIKAKVAEPEEWMHISDNIDWRSNLKLRKDLLFESSLNDLDKAVPAMKIENHPAKLFLSKVFSRLS